MYFFTNLKRATKYLVIRSSGGWYIMCWGFMVCVCLFFLKIVNVPEYKDRVYSYFRNAVQRTADTATE